MRRLILLAPLCLAGCKSGTEPLRAEALAVVAPVPIAASSGIAFTDAPVVELRDGNGALFSAAGIMVTASISSGAGTTGGTATRATDVNGRAVFSDLLVTGVTGSYVLAFTAPGLTPASATVTLGAGLPVTMTQSLTAVRGTVGTALTTLPSVVVKDASGNVVPGVTIDFSTSGGGLTGAQPITDAAGVATLGGWTLPTVAGLYQLSIIAEAPTVRAGLLVSATATPDVPASMGVVGDGQSGLYGTMLPAPVGIRVTDRYGNPTPGVAVTWGIVRGGGTLTPIDAATDATGVARASYRLGPVPGDNVVGGTVAAIGYTDEIGAAGIGFSYQIAVSVQHTCALADNSVAYCWGQNLKGQIGDGSITQRNLPTRVGGVLRFSRMGVSNGITCALTLAGKAYCWGSNGFAGIGDGTTTDRSVPTPVDFAGSFREITVGETATCGLELGSGAAYCWGASLRGELGAGSASLPTCTTSMATNFDCSVRPIAVAGGHAFSSISAGARHMCALTSSGELYCWGESLYWGGSSVVGIAEAMSTPVQVAPGMQFAEVAVGGTYTCAIALASGGLYCWGIDAYGEMGTGSAGVDQRTPALVMSPVMHADAGQLGTCGVPVDGRVQCWGLNESGAVGDGSTTNRSTPTTVSSAFGFTDITASGDHTCARANNHQLFCWGNNSEGQLGIGPELRMLLPTLVQP
jgi:alpha-tubulin suppressor-like RCC1 family protein